jgi:S-formylglutathione hydrolase FrmB
MGGHGAFTLAAPILICFPASSMSGILHIRRIQANG